MQWSATGTRMTAGEYLSTDICCEDAGRKNCFHWINGAAKFCDKKYPYEKIIHSKQNLQLHSIQAAIFQLHDHFVYYLPNHSSRSHFNSLNILTLRLLQAVIENNDTLSGTKSEMIHQASPSARSRLLARIIVTWPLMDDEGKLEDTEKNAPENDLAMG
ncbi:hypothetical protein CDAR_525921 [Caerostris darwini]|uniref:Uncharacterized protein n=1 Tax=Caerostris darwini TaxID=1538125 RepID=A0AAV4S5H8_9ARAC|nr:hypothetical protein CDAR_525921 [Caerostris darwini]